MGVVELIALAGSVSLLSGWRIYLCVFATGLAMRTGWLPIPDQLETLAVLADPWVIGAAFIGLSLEFLADKIAWFDSLWDTVHTVIRPLGGALLSLAIIDSSDPIWQVVAFLLGGGAALLSHGAKASARAAVNVSPEPVTNIAVSAGEDIATAGLLVAALANPVLAVVVFLLVLGFAVLVLWIAGRFLRRLFGRRPPPADQGLG